MEGSLELVNLINNIGFPIVITLYLIIKHDKTIEKNTEMLNKLITKIEKDGV